MADLFHDVDEALRRERMERFWREHGGLLVAAVAALVVGTGVFSVYKNHRAGQQEAQTEALQAALESADPAKALESFAAQGAPEGLRTLARLTAAGDLADQGKIQDALVAYDVIGADSGAEPLLRDRALVMAARLAAGEDGAHSIPPEQRLTALDAIIAQKDNPWAGSARISAALLCAGPLQDLARARQYLSPLLVGSANKKEDSDTPLSLVQMAQQLDHVWAMETATPPAPAKP